MLQGDRDGRCAIRLISGRRRSATWIVVETKSLELDETEMRKVDAPVVVVLDKTALAMSQDHKGVASSP